MSEKLTESVRTSVAWVVDTTGNKKILANLHNISDYSRETSVVEPGSEPRRGKKMLQLIAIIPIDIINKKMTRKMSYSRLELHLRLKCQRN